MNEEEIKNEVEQLFHKKHKELKKLAKDVIRQANTLPKAPASKEENLDLIKHLLKTMAVHQLIIEEQSKKTNQILHILTAIIAILTLLMAWEAICNLIHWLRGFL